MAIGNRATALKPMFAFGAIRMAKSEISEDVNPTITAKYEEVLLAIPSE
jgi:hypothetical protein